MLASSKFPQFSHITIDVIIGESGRRSVPSHPSVPTTKGVYDSDRRECARQDLDGHNVADDQRQDFRRRQARSSRHQGLRDGLHCRQTTAATRQTEDWLLPRQRRMITNPESDDRQCDVDIRESCRPDDAATIIDDELIARHERDISCVNRTRRTKIDDHLNIDKYTDVSWRSSTPAHAVGDSACVSGVSSELTNWTWSATKIAVEVWKNRVQSDRATCWFLPKLCEDMVLVHANRAGSLI